MLVNLAILAALFMPLIMATLSPEEMAETLIKAENGKILCTPFRSLKRNKIKTSYPCALVDVAKVPEHIPKVVTCLRTVLIPSRKRCQM